MKKRVKINRARMHGVQVRFREDEIETLRRVAEAEYTFVARWIRDAALRALARATKGST